MTTRMTIFINFQGVFIRFREGARPLRPCVATGLVFRVRTPPPVR